MRCPECGANGHSRKTKTPEWRCRKCSHEWDDEGQGVKEQIEAEKKLRRERYGSNSVWKNIGLWLLAPFALMLLLVGLAIVVEVARVVVVLLIFAWILIFAVRGAKFFGCVGWEILVYLRNLRRHNDKRWVGNKMDSRGWLQHKDSSWSVNWSAFYKSAKKKTSRITLWGSFRAYNEWSRRSESN